jgi:ADP-ribose pyrophosphatase
MIETQKFKRTDVEVQLIEERYRGYMKLLRYHLRHRLFAGGWSDVISRECLVSRDAVGVLLYDPILDKIVLTEQFRIGVLDDHHTPWVIDVVAGICDKGEDLDEVAVRESQEEAGCDILELKKIHVYYVSPGSSTQRFHVFYGRVDARGISERLHGLAHENEDIRAFTVTSDEAFKALANMEINNSLSIVSLQWLQLNREQLRAPFLKSL